FYVRLVQGQGVDEAIARARYAIRFNLPDATREEWIIPVLYLRSRGMRLFCGTSANYLDYTADAAPVNELIQQVDSALGRHGRASRTGSRYSGRAILGEGRPLRRGPGDAPGAGPWGFETDGGVPGADETWQPRQEGPPRSGATQEDGRGL